MAADTLLVILFAIGIFIGATRMRAKDFVILSLFLIVLAILLFG